MKETAKHQKSQHAVISYCKEKDAMSGECIFTILITETQKKERPCGLSFFVGLTTDYALKKVQFLEIIALFLVHIKIYS